MADPVTHTAKTVANRSAKNAAAQASAPSANAPKAASTATKDPKTADQLMSAPKEGGFLSGLFEVLVKPMTIIFAWDIGAKVVGSKIFGFMGKRDGKIGDFGTKTSEGIEKIDGILHTSNAELLESWGVKSAANVETAAPALAEVDRSTTTHGKASVANLIDQRLNIAAKTVTSQMPELEKFNSKLWSISDALRGEGAAGAAIADKLNTYAATARDHASRAENVSTSAEAYNTALKGMQKELGNAHGLMSGDGNKALSHQFKQDHAAIKGILEGESKSRFARGPKSTGGVLKPAAALEGNYNKLRLAQAPLQTLKTGLKSVPAALGKTSLHSTLFNGAFAAEMGVSGISLGKDIKFHLNNLRHLTEMMEGTKQVSNYHVLFSNDVPDVVKHARKQVFHQFGARTVIEAVSDAFTTYGIAKSKMIPMMMIPMAMRGMAGFTAPKYDFLSDYGALAEAQSQGMPLEGAHYAKLISGASLDVEKAGGDLNGLVADVAKHYAEKQTPIDQVLRDVESGAMNEIALELQKSRAAAGIAAGTMDPEAQARAEAEKENFDKTIAREPNHMGKKDAPSPKIETADSVHATPQQKAALPKEAAAVPTAIMPESAHIESMQQQGIQ